MYMLGICDTPEVLSIARYINIGINIIKIAVPFILLTVISINFVKALLSNNPDAVNDTLKNSVSKAIAAVSVFLVPTIVGLLLTLIDANDVITGCVGNITLDQIDAAYYAKMDEYISLAESKNSYVYYNSAQRYLANLRDGTKKDEYISQLKELKDILDASNHLNPGGSSTEYGLGKFKFVPKTDSYLGYAIYVPENIGNNEIPLIVWLHGKGEIEVSGQEFLGRGLPAVVNSWGSTGLKNIGAIIIAPQITRADIPSDAGWRTTDAATMVGNLLKKTISEYNIDTSRIILMGHSLGGIGVPFIGFYNSNYFSALVMLSNNSGYYRPNEIWAYVGERPIRGYCEIKKPNDEIDYCASMKGFYSITGHTDNAELIELNCNHGQVPREAMLLDSDGDGASDLVEWMLSQSK